MRRLTYLAAAAAATGVLALIPLATLASSASAAVTYPPPTQATSSTNSGNWAGYVMTAKGKDRFSYVYADFTVPAASNKKALRGYYSARSNTAAFWVGLGGTKGTQLDQGGVEIGDNAANKPYYWAFSEKVPASGGGPGAGPVAMPLNLVINGSGVPGKAITIHAGDKMSMEVSEQQGVPGARYVLYVMDNTQNKYGTATISGARGADNSAEIITEATDFGPSNDNGAPGFFDTGTVEYTYCYVSVGGSPGLKLPYTNPWGISPEPMWTTTKYTLGGIHVQILPPVYHVSDKTYYKTVERTSLMSVPGGWDAQGGGGLGYTSFNTTYQLTR